MNSKLPDISDSLVYPSSQGTIPVPRALPSMRINFQREPYGWVGINRSKPHYFRVNKQPVGHTIRIGQLLVHEAQIFTMSPTSFVPLWVKNRKMIQYNLGTFDERSGVEMDYPIYKYLKF